MCARTRRSSRIAAIFQKDPQVLIAHPGVGLRQFREDEGPAAADLQRRPLDLLAVSCAGKYGLSDAQLRPYNFNMAPFLADPRTSMQQGFVSSEPYLDRRRRWASRSEVLLIADAGFCAYQTTIAISRKLATEKKELVQRFVDATLEGWAQYLKGGPATEAAERADQEGQSRADRRSHRLCRQGAERAGHRAARATRSPAASAR